MTPEALRAALARHGLTQTGGASLCGVDDRTMRRWCAGEREIPPTVARVFWLFDQRPDLVELLRAYTATGMS